MRLLFPCYHRTTDTSRLLLDDLLDPPRTSLVSLSPTLTLEPLARHYVSEFYLFHLAIALRDVKKNKMKCKSGSEISYQVTTIRCLN